MMSIYALYELSVRVTAINDCVSFQMSINDRVTFQMSINNCVSFQMSDHRVSFQIQLVQMSAKIFRQQVSLLQRVAQQVQNSALKIMIIAWLL